MICPSQWLSATPLNENGDSWNLNSSVMQSRCLIRAWIGSSMNSRQSTNENPQSPGMVHQSAGSEVGRLVAAFWAVAELLRGDFKPFEYQDVILPLVFLLRIDGLDPLGEATIEHCDRLTRQHFRLLKSATVQRRTRMTTLMQRLLRRLARISQG